MDHSERIRKLSHLRPLSRLTGISLRDLLVSVLPLVLLTAAVIWLAFWYVQPAPPKNITISAGPPGSLFMTHAEKYRKILARDGVNLRVIPSQGSLDNLQRLLNPNLRVDLAFVQGGVATGMDVSSLVSLGSVFHEPLLIFYRSPEPVTLLSGFAGKKLAIAPEGSGTHMLALILLKANGIEPGGPTELFSLGGMDAAKALLEGRVDAAFLMGDSATPPLMKQLLWTPGIRLFDFQQSAGYSRKFPYLLDLDLPMGVFDFGKNMPPQDIHLIGPTVELVARNKLHPALSDLLIEAAREVHSRPTLLQKANEFPAPLEHEFIVSPDAKRFYNSGKSFLYRRLPFWLATLVDRTLVVFVPIVVLLIPGLKVLPAIYRWRIKSRIYRWYGALIAIERDILAHPSNEERAELLARLDEIEAQVNKMKMPLAYAEQFYVLRDHIKFVSDRYRENAEAR
ncbi:TAXI family TRAP transporter solute-binding subunit [Geomonas sp.]|uniref:TAXI family TRAP transporter solute-binding subunit n=1 Tax=Geomonas sp. TaxID=2651584 RepID=UPI002B471C35|nr:TAXI family TRAP transporter solute-binding subunit [Geomonas sp.]HJV34996.1 TAXI family TRAP transporter solute-binding subunit [Geomonas sp.]